MILGTMKRSNNNKFLVKMFGMDEKGKTYCIYVKGFEPFFYVLVQIIGVKKKQCLLNNG